MNDSEKETGVLAVLMERFEQQRLPRTLDLKDKVDKGEPLNEWDTGYLAEVLEDADQVKLLVDKHPEYQGLYARVVHLYNQITEKALENEKAAQRSGSNQD